jgi:hypothetical protein
MTDRIRYSSDLPDDVGRVFVTDVPGSWLQVYGRRAYGLLWVRSPVIQAKGQDPPAVTLAALMPGAEIVRGPEAEKLLQLIDEQFGEKIWREFLDHSGRTAAFERPRIGRRQ